MKRLVIIIGLIAALAAVGSASAASEGGIWKTPNQVSNRIYNLGVKHMDDGGVRVVTASYCEGAGASRRTWNGLRAYRNFMCAWQYANGGWWDCGVRTFYDPASPGGWNWTTKPAACQFLGNDYA